MKLTSDLPRLYNGISCWYNMQDSEHRSFFSLTHAYFGNYNIDIHAWHSSICVYQLIIIFKDFALTKGYRGIACNGGLVIYIIMLS